jgi:Xaa-Pro aminopeptidase
MRTVQPSIIIGSYGWDQDRLPRDEFQIRMTALNRVMDERGWKAMLIYGDADQHSALAYFSNFIPRLRWGMALLPREGEPRLLASMSSRDVPAMKLMTWIPDVLSGWTWESAFDPWLATLAAPEPVDIGTVGFELMRPVLMTSVATSLGNGFRLHGADDAVAASRTVRPREVSQMREASVVLAQAAIAAEEAWREGKGAEEAVLEGERAARMLAAQDVRTLVSFDGGRTLSPFRGAFEQKSGPLAAYIAVKHMGYWAETFVSTPSGGHDLRRRVKAACDAARRYVSAGAPAGLLYESAMKELGLLELHPVLSGSIGRRIGLSLNEGGEIRRECHHKLAPGEVYALHLGAYDPGAGAAFESAMLAVTADGADLLYSSPGPLRA